MASLEREKEWEQEKKRAAEDSSAQKGSDPAEQDGEVVVSNASAQAIRRVQAAFTDAADAMGVSSEDDVQTLVNEVRYGKG